MWWRSISALRRSGFVRRAVAACCHSAYLPPPPVARCWPTGSVAMRPGAMPRGGELWPLPDDAADGLHHIRRMGDPTGFRSIYRQGFARVAACTTRCTLADPAANAAAILEVAQACHRRGVALAVFPELGVSGYAISDLLHQSALLDAVEAAVAELVDGIGRSAAAAADRRAAAPRRRAVQLRAGDPSRQTARCGAEGPPAQLSRIL